MQNSLYLNVIGRNVVKKVTEDPKTKEEYQRISHNGKHSVDQNENLSMAQRNIVMEFNRIEVLI